jgi:hypothetical protein
MTSNTHAKRGDRIDYRMQDGTLCGFAMCIEPAIPGQHDGFWKFFTPLPTYPMRALVENLPTTRR